MPIIETYNIVKDFKDIKALDGISIKINEGEIFSLLGPNGAGKTTLISILTTILKPTSGTANVAGYDITKSPLDVRKNIGIVFQEPSLDDLLTAYENLYLHGMLYGMSGLKLKERVYEMLKKVELFDRKDHIVKTFSGGMKRRLEIARGILHIPKILFLDEPTLGLDPASRRSIWNYISKIKKEKNITIILTTHYLEEADTLSDRIAIINKGKIIALDTPLNLKKNLGDEIIKIKGELNTEPLKQIIPDARINKQNNFVMITSKNITPHIENILKLAKNITDIEIKKTSLEDVFLSLTGKKIEDLDETSDTN